MFEKPVITLVKFELKDILAASGESSSETEDPCPYDCPTHVCPNDLGF